jgi:glucosamine 6-phosphate synthetase-like amidotransferase/phosphosugar isomerase protein
METVYMVILGLCFFLSAYFVILSLFVIEDELQRVQFLAMGTSFFVGGAVITILYIFMKIVAIAHAKNEPV